MTDSLLLAVHAFASRVLMSVSVDQTLLLRLVNKSNSFRELPFGVEMSPLWLEKAWRQLYKNAGSSIEQILKAAPHKAAAVRLLTAHHENYPC